eukprot:TRINITY_DN12135_c0_g1_i3.p3 TRINITY_DN12135_c0_g1~~TRINITY_DN12135_c0_g1_i3.p3  ORF type:complete len:116 (-),score=3.64 TRINITY_DN12135_c0_g1_i3:169-516(-)
MMGYGYCYCNRVLYSREQVDSILFQFFRWQFGNGYLQHCKLQMLEVSKGQQGSIKLYQVYRNMYQSICVKQVFILPLFLPYIQTIMQTTLLKDSGRLLMYVLWYCNLNIIKEVAA